MPSFSASISYSEIRVSAIPRGLHIMNQEDNFPPPPDISEEQLKRCRDTGDYCPVIFEWYKFVGELCVTFTCIHPTSPAFSPITPLHHGVLIGLLNRCSRLMLANVALSHAGVYGETTSILDRCIFESCIKTVWLCEESTKDKFDQFLADGLKTDLELEKKIHASVALRNNKTLVIEERMLASINQHVDSSGLSKEQIGLIKRLPPMDQMMGVKSNDLEYIVGQKIGSHHVHGTWPSLLLHYIRLAEDGFFIPRDHDSETHVNQYIITMLFILMALESFSGFVLSESEDKQNCLAYIKATRVEILKLNKEIVGNDFELLSDI